LTFFLAKPRWHLSGFGVGFGWTATVAGGVGVVVGGETTGPGPRLPSIPVTTVPE
jgi:hypothetical protein